jgi:hypothetical protein
LSAKLVLVEVDDHEVNDEVLVDVLEKVVNVPPNDDVEPPNPPNPPNELVEPPNDDVEPPKLEVLVESEPPLPGPAPGPEVWPLLVCVDEPMQWFGATQMHRSFWHSPHSRLLFMQWAMHCCG